MRWWGGSGISWTICKSFAPHSRQITTSVPHHSVFLQVGCLSCRPTNSVKALKAIMLHCKINKKYKCTGSCHSISEKVSSNSIFKILRLSHILRIVLKSVLHIAANTLAPIILLDRVRCGKLVYIVVYFTVWRQMHFELFGIFKSQRLQEEKQPWCRRPILKSHNSKIQQLMNLDGLFVLFLHAKIYTCFCFTTPSLSNKPTNQITHTWNLRLLRSWSWQLQ